METKLVRNETDQRYELHIEGKLIGYTEGTPEDHEIGARNLVKLAEEKGHTVILEGVSLDD